MDREITVQEVQSKIIKLPGRPPAMLDKDLAVFYETEVKYVNRAVKRNPKRFPSDFFFQLTDEADILRFQYGTAISNMSRFNPKAFTREGCNMMSACLKTPIAVDRSVFIMRAFSAMEAQAWTPPGGQMSFEQLETALKCYKVSLEILELLLSLKNLLTPLRLKAIHFS